MPHMVEIVVPDNGVYYLLYGSFVGDGALGLAVPEGNRPASVVAFLRRCVFSGAITAGQRRKPRRVQGRPCVVLAPSCRPEPVWPLASPEIAVAGYWKERGQPFNPQSVRAMIEGPQPRQRRARNIQ